MLYQDKTLDAVIEALRDAKLTDEARAMGFTSPLDVVASLLPPTVATALRARMKEREQAQKVGP
jgi:hypothetical protein